MSRHDNTGNISRQIVTARKHLVTNVIQAQDNGVPIKFKNAITVDSIEETTKGAGVMVAGVKHKDGMVFDGSGSMLECQTHKDVPNGYLGLTNKGLIEVKRLPFKHNMSATRPPNVDDDINNDYIPGSRWLDTTNTEEWVCARNTPSSAVWKQTTYVEYGEYGFEDIDDHINDTAKHHEIDDAAGIGDTTKLWSADKTATTFAAQADADHTHEAADVTDLAVAITTNPTIITNTAHAAMTSGNPHMVTKSQIGLANVQNTKNNFSTSRNPTVDDDDTLGYTIGSRWINSSTKNIYACATAVEGAAIWKKVSDREFDVIVSADGTEDFTSVAAAFASGANSVFIRDGIYVETEDINMPYSSKLVGETTAGVIITWLGAPKSIRCDSSGGIKETIGTVSITTGSNTVVGTGTTFTNLKVNDYIRLDQNFYHIIAIPTDTSIILSETYKGAALINETYIAQTMYSGVVMENFIVTGSGSHAIYMRGIRSSLLHGIAVMTSFSGMYMEDCATNNLVSINAFDNYTAGITFDTCYSQSIVTSEVYNNANGLVLKGDTSNIVVNGILSSNNSNNGIDVIDNAQKLTLNDCVIQRNAGDGIYTADTTGSIICDGCLLLYNNGAGIEFASMNNLVTSCAASHNGSYGIHIGASGVVCGNHIHDNGNHGVYLGDIDDCQVTGNTIYSNAGTGIWANGSRNTIDGNSVRSNTESGIMLVGGDDNIISNNSIITNTNNGLCLEHDEGDGSRRNVISNNRFVGNNVGICLCENSDKSLLDGNYVSDSISFGIQVESHENTITNNICDLTGGTALKIFAGATGNVVKNNRVSEYIDNGTDTINDFYVDDSITTTKDVWSGSKVSNELATKSDTGHSHIAADITDLTDTISTNPDVVANTAHIVLTNNPHSVTKTQIGLSNVENTKNKIATTNPTATNNSTQGYSVGSTWINYTNDMVFKCMDSGVSAIWKCISITDHSQLNGVGAYTHTQIDSHIDDDTKHRVIDDAQATTTNPWSGNKINSELATKSDTGHTHIAANITDFNAAADARIALQKAVDNGLATLGPDGKVPANQLNLDSVQYQSAWNADTNTPEIVSGVGTKGHYYVVSHAGATDIDGETDWQPPDWIIFNGSTWEKADHSNAVTSVAGKQGNVVLEAADITDWAVAITAHADVTAATNHAANTSNPHNVTKAQLGLNYVLNIKHKIDATTDPTGADDVNNGYSIGSHWVNVTTDRTFECVKSDVGEAIWRLTSTMDTDDVAEGSNLYYTNDRFDARLAVKDTDDLSEGSNLYYTEARVNANIAGKNTDDLLEGSNLYYTEARVNANIAAKDTDDLSEGSNLYYTEARVNANIAGKDTDDLSEGSNLYYTEERVTANVNVAANTAHKSNVGNPHSVTAAQVGNTTAQWNADQFQGVDVSVNAPMTNQVLKYNGTKYVPDYIFDEEANVGFIDDFLGSTLSNTWMVDTAGEGANVSHIDGIGGQIEITSGTTTNDFAYITTGRKMTDLSSNMTLTMRVKSNSTNTKINCGVRLDADNAIEFEYNATTVGNWTAKTVLGGVATTTDCGVTMNDSNWYNLRIVTTAVSVKFYINGTLVATHTTNLYTGLMYIRLIQTSNINDSKKLKVDYVKFICSRSDPGTGGGECIIL